MEGYLVLPFEFSLPDLPNDRLTVSPAIDLLRNIGGVMLSDSLNISDRLEQRYFQKSERRWGVKFLPVAVTHVCAH